MTTEVQTYVGIDVSKDKLDVAVWGETTITQVANTPKGIASLIQYLQRLKPQRIVVEATGGYEEALVLALADSGLPVALVSPQRVRQYAKAKGLLAKSDTLDAGTLADFGRTLQPRIFEAKSEAGRELSALVGRRKQVGELLKAEKNRRRMASAIVRKSLERVVECLEEELAALDEAITQFWQAHAEFAEQAELLRSAKSVGPVTAATLLADLPELGQLDRKAIAALVGVAPLNQDSGHKRGYRKTKGGRPDVHSVLYMSTLNGISHNPVLKAHYAQLVQRGKAKKVAITACMRKLLTILNAMVRDQKPFRMPALAV